MEEYIVKISHIENVTHDVKRFRVEKPSGYSFIPGQATEVSVNTAALRDERRPFTFTCLNTDPFLEFTIKIYTDHDGVTNELGKLKPGNELIVRDVWGAINYKGPGVFLAGGAGITPFIAIFRQLYNNKQTKGNTLYFSNKTSRDIILKDEFERMLGNNFINVLTREKSPQYENRHIDKVFIREKIQNFDQPFYICGPDAFVSDLLDLLAELGAKTDALVIET